METNFPAILIKAKIKNQLLLRNYLEDSLKAKFYLSKTIKETFTFSQRIKIDLIIFETTYIGTRNIHIGNLHKILSREGSIPIIYIVQDGLQKRFSFEDLKTGTFDLLTLPFDKFLFVNRVKLFLQINGINAASGKIQNKHFLVNHINENPAQLLNERTKQLSTEIQDHIKTRVELFHQNIRLDENQHVFSALLDTIPNPLVIKNSKGEYLQCNRAFEQFCGIKSSELIGKTAYDYFDQDSAIRFEQSDKDRLKSKKVCIQEYSHIRPDGSVAHLMIYKNAFPVGKNAESGTIATIVDVTHIKSAEDLLKVQYTIDYLASLDKGIKSVLKLILDHIFKLYWVDAGGIYLYDKKTKQLNLVCHKGLSKKYVSHVKSYQEDSPEIKWLLNHTHYYMQIQDLMPVTRDLVKEEGILSVAIIPLIDRQSGEVLGSLNLASKKIEKISEENKKGIESIAKRMVSLIAYAQVRDIAREAFSLLESRVKEKTTELQDKVRDLITEAYQHNLTKNALINLQNNIPIGLFSTSPKGEILYGNPAVYSIFGYDSMDDIKKVTVMDLYYSKEKRDELLQILLTKGQLPGTEMQLLRKDKSVFWGMVHAQAVFDKQGNPVQFDGVVEDISEMKMAKIQLEEAHKEILLINQNLKLKVEEALEKQEDQYSLLIQKSKLESLGELSAGIAHEINQPLGVMAMSLENLKLKIDFQKITPQYLNSKFQSINDNIKRIRDIIDHIRIFSREQDSFVLDKVNINEVVQNALSMIGTQYRNHNINIRLDLKENIGFTVGSELKLEQVILNLLANAKYALDEKGILKGETEFSKEIQIKTNTTPDKIILMVVDNGIGIEAKHLTRIFDPFFTTKPEGYGTGLGLSIVYGLVKDMRGEIFVTSKEKKYTKFKIIFPRFPEKN